MIPFQVHPHDIDMVVEVVAGWLENSSPTYPQQQSIYPSCLSGHVKNLIGINKVSCSESRLDPRGGEGKVDGVELAGS